MLEELLFGVQSTLVCVDNFYDRGNKFDDQEFKAKASSIARILGDERLKGKWVQIEIRCLIGFIMVEL